MTTAIKYDRYLAQFNIKPLELKIKKTEIRVVCAWCGKDMGEKDGQGVEGESHGMCEECYGKETKEGDC